MGLKENDYCSFCNQYPETSAHLFWECTHVDIFWRSLKTTLITMYFVIGQTLKSF